MTSQSLALVVVAAVAALIAYLQWVTAHQKVVVELFDRRRKAFELVEEALRPVFRDGEVSKDAFAKLWDERSQCKFLFGDDVNGYLDNLHRDFAWLSSYTDPVIDRSNDRDKLIDQKYEKIGRIVEFAKNGAPLFVPYLRLDMKMRYFWPLFPMREILTSLPSLPRQLLKHRKKLQKKRKASPDTQA